jgi:hypothetical protein
MKNKKIVTTNSTQDILEIADIKDNMVILKDGTVRAVLMVSSINFALKNQDEQEGIISAFYSFLNSISYPLQIVIQSRPLDIDHYLDKLDKLGKQQTNELLRIQTMDYTQFIRELLQLQSIMSKKFFVIVPYSVVEGKKKNFFDKAGDLFSAQGTLKIKKKEYEDYKDQLFRRVGHIRSGLEGMSLQSALLDTSSLIELYYNSYNPEVSKREKLKDIEQVRVDD